MGSKEKLVFVDRRFLNRGEFHSLAAVSGKVRLETDTNWEPIIIEFSLSNCDRSISLDFDSDTLEALENSIYKLEQIEKVARGAKEALIKSTPVFEEWLEKKRIRDEEHKKKSESSD